MNLHTGVKMVFGMSQGRAIKQGKQVLPGVFYFGELPNLDCNTYVFQSQDRRATVFDPGNGLSFNPLLEACRNSAFL